MRAGQHTAANQRLETNGAEQTEEGGERKETSQNHDVELCVRQRNQLLLGTRGCGWRTVKKAPAPAARPDMK